MLAMTLNFFRHCEEGEDRRGNPEPAIGVSSAAVPVAGSHGLLRDARNDEVFSSAVCGVEPACRKWGRTGLP